MFNKKLSDQFSKGLLDEVKKIMKKKEKEAPEMDAPESSCEEYSPVKAAGDTRQIQARIHGAKTTGTLKNKPAAQYKKDGTLYKEGVVPTNDMPTQKDRQTAAKVADLLAKEKKVKKVAEGSDLPWKEDPKNPSHTVGVHKDQYGNVIKNVAKHLAKKAMKANEEVEQIDEATLKSNKDGESGSRGATFSSKSPNSYKVIGKDGEHLATAHSAKDPKYGGRTTHWSVTWHKAKHKDHPGSFQYMHQLKKHVKELEEEAEIHEVAPAGAKYERMIKHIKKGYAKDGKLNDQEKSIAYATAWKAKKANEAVGDVTVKKLSPADAFKKHTGQDTKPTSVPKDPKTGKTLYQKVTSEEAELEESTYDKMMTAKKAWATYPTASNEKAYKAAKELHKKTQAAMKEEAEQVDEALDSMSDARIKYHATKNFPHGKYSSKEIDAEHKRRMKAVPNYHSVKASLGEEAEQIDETDEGWYSHHQMYGKVSKENWKKGWRYNQHKDKPFYHQPTKSWHASIKEEVEQIDELKTSTLDSYRNKARGQIIAANNKDTATTEKRLKGYTKASQKIGKNFAQGKYEEFEQDAMNLSNEEFEAKWLTPQVNELDEAFEALTEGRPKVMIQHPWDKNRKLHPVKDKDIIAKLREKGYTNLGDRPSTENPINQLRKASTSMTGGHHVTLHTGEKHHVTNAQASRILDKHAGMKTAKEKLDYQDKLRDKEFLQKEAGK